MSAVTRSATWSAFRGPGRTHLRSTGDRRRGWRYIRLWVLDEQTGEAGSWDSEGGTVHRKAGSRVDTSCRGRA